MEGLEEADKITDGNIEKESDNAQHIGKKKKKTTAQKKEEALLKKQGTIVEDYSDHDIEEINSANNASRREMLSSNQSDRRPFSQEDRKDGYQKPSGVGSSRFDAN